MPRPVLYIERRAALGREPTGADFTLKEKRELRHALACGVQYWDMSEHVARALALRTTGIDLPAINTPTIRRMARQLRRHDRHHPHPQ